MYTDRDGNAELLQEEAYYPFGMRIPSMSKSYSGSSDDRYLYNGKELEDRIKGFHFSDYGARFYDAALGRWHSVDPLAEEYFAHSNYHFSGNSPLNYVDKNGMSYDGYTIDQDGYIERVDDTGGDTEDVLYSKEDYAAAKKTGKVNNEGNPEPENQVRVNDVTILPALTEKTDRGSDKLSQVTTSTNTDDALKIFKFASENSNVEWAIKRYDIGNGEKYSLSTLHNEDYCSGHVSLGIPLLAMKASVHSHPGIPPTLKGERSSMGDTSDGSGGGTSDWQRSIMRYNKNGRDLFSEYVYFPNSKSLYQITPWKINKVK